MIWNLFFLDFGIIFRGEVLKRGKGGFVNGLVIFCLFKFVWM